MIVDTLTAPSELLPPPDAETRALLFRAAAAELITTGDTAPFDELQQYDGFTVAINDPTGHFPAEVVTPGHIRTEAGSRLSRWYILGSRIARTTVEQAADLAGQASALRTQQQARPRQFTLRLGNLAAIQPVEE